MHQNKHDNFAIYYTWVLRSMTNLDYCALWDLWHLGCGLEAVNLVMIYLQSRKLHFKGVAHLAYAVPAGTSGSSTE